MLGRIAAGIGLTGTAVVPPVLLALFGQGFASTPLGVVAIIAYEFTVAVVAFLSPIASSLRTRWTDRLTEVADLSSQRILSGYRRRVIDYVKASNSHVDYQGLITIGTDALRIDEVFINLALDSAAVHSLDGNPVEYGSKSSAQTRDMTYWLTHARRNSTAMVIVGPPGSGKTTLLRRFAHSVASSSREARRLGMRRVVPVLVLLRKHARNLNSDFTLPDLVRSALSEVDGTPPEGWIESQLTKGRMILLFDGLDEVSDPDRRATLTDWIDRQRRSYNRNQFILTSRPLGYKSNPLASATVLQVCKMTRPQVRGFISSWYQATTTRRFGRWDKSARLASRRSTEDLMERIDQSPALADLAANPLLLTMIANVHQYRGALPGTRAELYREVCEVFLGGRHQARGVQQELEGGKARAVLEVLAFSMMKKRVRDVTPADAEKIVKDKLATVAPRMTVSAFLHNIELSSGILLEREAGVYSFAHLTLQEFLAAAHMTQRGLFRRSAIEVDDPWWHETLRLYCAQTDATPVIEKCLGTPVLNVATAALAVDCMREARELHPTTRDRLDALLNPAEVRIDAELRRTAALLRILLNERAYIRVSEGEQLAPSPVSCLEYQHFLDESSRPGSFVPDHWKEAIFPDGEHDLPVTGLRAKAIGTFLSWYSRKVSDPSYSYFVPTVEQLSIPEVQRRIHESSSAPSHLVAINGRSGFEVVTLRATERMDEYAEVLSQLVADEQRFADFEFILESSWPGIAIQRIQDDPECSESLTRLSVSFGYFEGFEGWLSGLIRHPAPYLHHIGPATSINPEAVALTTLHWARTIQGWDGWRRPNPALRKFDDSLDLHSGFDYSWSKTSRAATVIEGWFTAIAGATGMALRRDEIARPTQSDRRDMRFIGRAGLLVAAHISTVLAAEGFGPGDLTVELPEAREILDIYGRLSLMEARIERDLRPRDAVQLMRKARTVGED